MKKTILLCLCMVLTVWSVLAAAPTTPVCTPVNGSVYFNGTAPVISCSSTDADGDDINYTFYYFNETAVTGGNQSYHALVVTQTWASAEASCVAFHPDFHLVTVDDAAEQAAIEAGPGAGFHWWMGLHHNATENWNWLAGNTTGYTNYDSGEPDTNECVFAEFTKGYNWSDTLCSDAGSYKGLCEGFPGEWQVLQNSSSATYTWNSFATETGINLSGQFYVIAYDDTGAFSAATEYFNYYNANFEHCSDDIALNFTGRDEELLTHLNVTFDADLTLSVPQGDTDFNFNWSANQTHTLCLLPAGLSANVTGLIDYDSNNASYSYPRQYYFDDAEISSSSPQDIALYQLSDTYATAVTFQAIRDGTGVGDIIIHLQRYNPGTGIYTLGAMAETNSQGEDVIYLRLTDAWYRVLAYEDGSLVYSSGSIHIIDTTYTMYLSGGEGGYTTYWDIWDAFRTITYNLSYNETSNYSILTVDDSSGASTSLCLRVDKYYNATSKNICYTCSSSASVTISCGLEDNSSYYVATFIAYQDSIWRVIDDLHIDLTSSMADLIGLDGVFYAFILVAFLAGVGLFSPSGAVVLSIAGVVISQWFGLIHLTWGAIGGLIIAGGILLFKMKD